MKITKQELLEGLAALDPKSDADWTEEGLPALERVQSATLDDTVTREDINVAANGYTREIALERTATDDAVAKVATAAEDVAKVTPTIAPTDNTVETAARRAKLHEVLDRAQSTLADHDVALVAMRDKRQILVDAVDRAHLALHAEYPPKNQAEVTAEWVERQKELRQTRADAQFLVKGTKSPLDASMQRRLGHGNGRKAVPPVDTQAI